VVRDIFVKRQEEVAQVAHEWQARFAKWRAAHPDLSARWDVQMSREVPAGLADRLPKFEAGKEVATRNASEQVLQVLSAQLPGLVGGSADLHPSTKTLIKKETAVSRGSYSGRNFHFGVREHTMGGTCNGISLHGGFIPYCGTFLIFSDYMRPSVRLASIMRQHVIYVYTHDSVFLGEDGPTHEPIEHLASLRAMPHLTVIRPADATEVPVAWMAAIERKAGPTALILTRQNLPVFDRSQLAPAEGLLSGGYILRDAPNPEMILIASGSEVCVALGAAKLLEQEGRRIRLVNLGSWELFEEQSQAYRDSVLPPSVPLRLAIEAAASFGWERYVGAQGAIHGIDDFGHSAPWKVIAQKLGFTPEAIAAQARKMFEKS
jgi:transketolase